MGEEIIPVRKGTVAAKVDHVEEQRNRLRALAGEMIATLAIEHNQNHTIAELKEMVAGWHEYHQKLCQD